MKVRSSVAGAVALLFVGAALVAVGTTYGQNSNAGNPGANAGNQGANAGAQSGNAGGAGGIDQMGGLAGQQGQTARVPQYWVADATLFIANAWNTASILTKEASFNVQEPAIFASQAGFLEKAVNRAIDDLGALEQNALQTQPAAVPAIRNVMAQLRAAQAQAAQVVAAGKSGMLGPTYQVTVQSAMNHLQSALKEMSAVGKHYGAADLAQIQSGANAGSGSSGAGNAGVSGSAGAAGAAGAGGSSNSGSSNSGSNNSGNSNSGNSNSGAGD